MPRIASFGGVVIKLYFNDHPPPHIHVYAGRIGRPGVKAARFSIDTGELIDGVLPPASVATVTSWCVLHREALRADWQRAQRNLHPTERYD
jgi:Domain of unknown function (DUF4160)